jgi:hypothetical protein
MDIHLDRRAVRQIRLSTQEAIDEGDLEALREGILDRFTEDQVEEIEQHLESGDLFEFLSDIISDWGGDDVDELLELLETQFGEAGIGLRFDSKATAEEDGEEPEEEEDEPDEDEDDEVLDKDLDEDLGEEEDEP